MSYGGQSNAAWQRNMMQGHPQSGGYHQGSQMFMPNAQQNNMAAFGHGGMQGGGNMFPGGGSGGGGGNSVSYPQPRSGLNPVAFQQGGVGGGGGGQSHFNSMGHVTKMSNDCGLVNDEVFFYRNVCKGPDPKVGDRVIFEASYSNSGQFKWNATRVQVMQQPQPLMSSNKSTYNTVPPPNEYQRGQMRRNSPNRSPIRGRHERDHRERERLHRSRDRDEDEHERKRRREDRSRDHAVVASNRGGAHGARNEKERLREESRKKERELTDREREDREREREKERARDLEIHRAVAKGGRRARAVRRYMVQIPKALLTIKTADVQDLRQRYSSLYIPSDFFHANIKWSDTFTPENPFSLRRPCQFHIMHESVESPNEQSLDLLEPADASYLYSAKVMLMSLPPIAELYKKCFENDDDDIDHHAVHPSRLINFLVGVKGRIGSMAIGGPWSASLDGENPDKDPSVLIRTAIRTCKALTGIDLSNCTQWYRFVELFYHRTEYKNMEKDGPPRVETVVIYLPDVHSCIPSIEEWQTLSQIYKTAADDVIARRAALVAAANANDDKDKADDVEMTDKSELADTTAGEEGEENPTADNNETTEVNDEEVVEIQDEEQQDENMDDSNVSADISGAVAEDNNEDGGADVEEHNDDTTDAVEENEEPAPEPTHYSLLDLKNMKVQEIRDELLARNLSDKGVRNVVMARLAKALNTEKSEEMKNKNKNKQATQQPKTVAAKKSNEATNKTKKEEDKMEVDSDTISSKPVDKKASNTENKKKSEKKGATAENNVKANERKNKDMKAATGKRNAAKVKQDKEDKEGWADIDFELGDIVILDEYDSSKNVEETTLKEMTEKEKTQLIRRYTLPSSPHIIVHPNRQAKGGKFDCAVVSLSVLLDYHPDDSKERFFEVSLFAELFNDMLMRDFGFTIYKEMYLYKEPSTTSNESEITEVKTEGGDAVKNEKSETVEEIKKESKEKNEEKEKSSKKDNSKSTNEEKPGKDDNKHNEDTQSIKSESRKRKLSTSASTVNGKEVEKSVSEKKMVVVKPQLLLSFVYFDTSHCGYIYDKHLEELFFVLGLNLSRSQIRKVLGKFVTLQPMQYRKLTDKEESLESTPVIEDIDDLPIEELKRIAAGNYQYESVFGRKGLNNQISSIKDGDNKDGLTNYNGTIVHVGKLLNQINRTEKNYSDLEKIYNDLLKQHTDLQKDHNKANGKIKDLQTENKNVHRKLTDVNQDFYSLNRKYRDQNATLSYIYTRVAPYFVREKDKEKDAKTEGSRDKDKDEKEKEKEKDKSKDKETEKEKEKEKEKPKDDKEKDKPKEEKEKLKENKEQKPKDNKEKEKPKEEKNEKEKEIKKVDNKDKEKSKDETTKETVKDDKEKEKMKNGKEKEKIKDDKEKEQPNKNDRGEKEKPKEEKQKEKTKDEIKVKPTPQKHVIEKTKTLTPAAKKLADSKPTGKIIKKVDSAAAKK